MDVVASLASAKAGGSMDASARQAQDALNKAAREGDAEKLSRAIVGVADLNARGTWDGMTALHWTAEKGHVECARVLLNGGANVDARDSNNWTPLMVAAQKNGLAMARFLLSRGANSAASSKGMTASDLAMSTEMRQALGVVEAADDPARRDGEAPPSSRTRAGRARAAGDGAPVASTTSKRARN